MQQLDSGGFLRYGEEDVEEDAAVLEMLAALDISPDDGRFVKNGHTVLDGMMDWYQESYFDGAPAPGQGSTDMIFFGGTADQGMLGTPPAHR